MADAILGALDPLPKLIPLSDLTKQATVILKDHFHGKLKQANLLRKLAL